MPLRPIVTVGFVDALLVMVNCPEAAPTAVGSKVSVTDSVWPGFSVAGRLTGEAEKPLPVTAMVFTVIAAVPLAVNVTVCVVALLMTVSPNATLVAFTLSPGVPAFSCSATVRKVLPVVAVRTADCALVTASTVAVKVALVAVAGTVTEAGTVTALLLLARVTTVPPLGAEPDKLTVQESPNAPVMEVLLQEIALTVGATAVPVPLRLTATAGALLDRVNCPVTELALVGVN